MELWKNSGKDTNAGPGPLGPTLSRCRLRGDQRNHPTHACVE